MKNLKTSSIGLAVIIALAGSGCKDKNNDIILPPIGGYNTSNDVAASSLKAYWNFDGSLNETKSSAAPVSSLRTSFVTGIKGQAVKLDSGYILYPTIAALNTTSGSLTISTWIFTQNQGNGSRPTGVVALTAGSTQTDWNVGPMILTLENGRPVTYNDTLVLKANITTYKSGIRLQGDNLNDFGIRETDFKTVKGANKWVHMVGRYDGSGSFLDIFANGVRVSNNNFRFREVGGVGFGPMAYQSGTQTQVLVGGYPNTTTGFPNSPLAGFQGLFRGNIDQVRIYDKSLTDDEILSLYQLELAGR
ncbi:MAG: LamG-like jellyroll fold domain-containing protein [Ferruginibacter sp.]